MLLRWEWNDEAKDRTLRVEAPLPDGPAQALLSLVGAVDAMADQGRSQGVVLDCKWAIKTFGRLLMFAGAADVVQLVRDGHGLTIDFRPS